MAIRIGSCRHGHPLESGVHITIEHPDDFAIYRPTYMPGSCLDEFVMKARDKRGWVTLALSRDEARRLAEWIVQETAILCEDCGADITDEQYRGYCRECYCYHIDEDEE